MLRRRHRALPRVLAPAAFETMYPVLNLPIPPVLVQRSVCRILRPHGYARHAPCAAALGACSSPTRPRASSRTRHCFSADSAFAHCSRRIRMRGVETQDRSDARGHHLSLLPIPRIPPALWLVQRLDPCIASARGGLGVCSQRCRSRVQRSRPRILAEHIGRFPPWRPKRHPRFHRHQPHSGKPHALPPRLPPPRPLQRPPTHARPFLPQKEPASNQLGLATPSRPSNHPDRRIPRSHPAKTRALARPGQLRHRPGSTRPHRARNPTKRQGRTSLHRLVPPKPASEKHKRKSSSTKSPPDVREKEAQKGKPDHHVLHRTHACNHRSTVSLASPAIASFRTASHSPQRVDIMDSSGLHHMRR
ncbi:hypothetical protein L1887_57704 [Cichorium endivia]|nr:hypothetical protein L1887_57704 [Cichorium endivia]